jgi:hypothetical protein
VSATVSRLTTQYVVPGAYELSVAMDGQVGLRSGKGVIIAKRPLIPLPKQMKLPQDPAGDRPATYLADGIYGTGPPHLVHDMAQPGVANASQVRAAAFLDHYDYLFNWKSFRHAFHYHTLDWYVPQEADMPSASAFAAGLPAYGGLVTSQYLPTPTPFTLKVDERYGNVLYFPNSSFMALLEDGGILFVDGWGSEFLMSGGSMRRSCAGDIWDLPGKNLNVWAGQDIVQRANGYADISANSGDVRIKAQGNIMGLAGLGGCGGFLFESRAVRAGYQYDANEPAVSGFVVRCPQSPVVLMGQDMLLTTRYPSQGNHLVLDAGTAKVVAHGSYVEAWAANAVNLIPNGVVHEFWSGEINLSSDLSVTGKAVVSGCGMFGTSVSAPTVAGALAKYDTVVSAAVTAALGSVSGRQTTLATYATAAAPDVIDLVTRAPAIETVQFVWRDSARYGTVGLALYEPRWQQVARLTGQSLAKWTENAAVDAASSSSYPHPGKAAWHDSSSYGSENLLLHNQTTDLAASRGSAYESAVYAVPSFSVLDGNYPVIANPS